MEESKSNIMTAHNINEEPPKDGLEGHEAKNPDDQGKRTADDGSGPQGRGGCKKFKIGGLQFATYIDLMDTVENIFLATQGMLQY